MKFVLGDYMKILIKRGRINHWWAGNETLVGRLHWREDKEILGYWETTFPH